MVRLLCGRHGAARGSCHKLPPRLVQGDARVVVKQRLCAIVAAVNLPVMLGGGRQCAVGQWPTARAHALLAHTFTGAGTLERCAFLQLFGRVHAATSDSATGPRNVARSQTQEGEECREESRRSAPRESMSSVEGTHACCRIPAEHLFQDSLRTLVTVACALSVLSESCQVRGAGAAVVPRAPLLAPLASLAALPVALRTLPAAAKSRRGTAQGSSVTDTVDNDSSIGISVPTLHHPETHGNTWQHARLLWGAS